MKEEFWKQIEEIPEYEVSTIGRVRSLKTGNMIVGTIDKDGYPRVTLSTKGPNGDWPRAKKVTRFRHRLVALAFIPNPNNWPQVNHIDENKMNSNVENLEWCTIKYNHEYGEGAKRRTAKIIETNKILHPAKRVYVYDKITHAFVGEYESLMRAAKELQGDYRSIYKVAHGEGKSHHGMIFSLEPLQFD